MQSSFVEIGPGGQAGDEVVLLGDGMIGRASRKGMEDEPSRDARAPCGLGVRRYVDE